VKLAIHNFVTPVIVLFYYWIQLILPETAGISSKKYSIPNNFPKNKKTPSSKINLLFQCLIKSSFKVQPTANDLKLSLMNKLKNNLQLVKQSTSNALLT